MIIRTLCVYCDGCGALMQLSSLAAWPQRSTIAINRALKERETGWESREDLHLCPKCINDDGLRFSQKNLQESDAGQKAEVHLILRPKE